MGTRTYSNVVLPTFPAGALGIWKAKDYIASPRKVVPNAVSAAPISSNILHSASTALTSGLGLSFAGGTITYNYANGPTRTNSAIRLFAAGFGYYNDSFNIPAGNYTICADVKSNTGSSQNIRFGDFNISLDAKVVTTSWQRFTKTVTSTGVIWAMIISPDATTGFDVVVDNFQIFAGNSDLGADNVLGGHAYLDAHQSDDKSLLVGPGVLDMSHLGSGAFMQFDQQQSITQFTASCLACRQPVISQGYDTFFTSPELGYGVLSCFFENGANYGVGYFGSALASINGLWDYVGSGWHVHTHKFDGTNYYIFLDDRQIYKGGNATVSAQIFTYLLSFSVNNVGQYSTCHYVNTWCYYPFAMTNNQIYTQLYPAMKMQGEVNGIVVEPVRTVFAEGDSITAGGGNYYSLYASYITKPAVGANYAISGSAIGDMIGRATGLDASIPISVSPKSNILTVLIGANDLGGYAGATDTIAATNWTNALFAYTDARRAAGWKVGICTVLPYGGTSGVNTFNTRRNLANPIIRSSVGTHCDFVIDFDTDAQMGVDNSFGLYPANWSDVTHPAAAGHARLAPVYAAAVNAVA